MMTMLRMVMRLFGNLNGVEPATGRTKTRTLPLFLFTFYYYVCCCWLLCEANPDAKRLYDDLLSNYNRLIRPVGNNSDKLTVKLGLKLSQLIDVNLKNQIMTTNVWVWQEWDDYKLVWDPAEYGGVKTLHVPSEHIWLPDIVLYNNADGNYELTIMTKAELNYTGHVIWRPPAIYKSSCEMNVQYFPFDVQNCTMKFGSWTYDGYMVDLKHIQEVTDSKSIDVGIDLAKFTMSVEWDVMQVPAIRNEKFYSCCDEPYLDITFYIVLRRKSLFYTVNLIIPCVGISFLSVLVFYLPSDSGEKVSLSISILLSLTVFFLLLAEIIPPTSLAVPLLGKYLLFTMILVTLSVVVTVVVLNVNFRSPSTHKMAPWVRKLFVEFLPKILFIERPPPSSPDGNGNGTGNGNGNGKDKKSPLGVNGGGGGSSSGRSTGLTGVEIQDNVIRSSTKDLVNIRFSGAYTEDIYGHQELVDERLDLKDKLYCVEIERAIQNIHFIAQHKRNRDDFEQVEADWKYVAMVLDRVFLILFSTACVLGTIFIIFEAPSLYDKNEPIDRKMSTVIQQHMGLVPVVRDGKIHTIPSG